MSLAGAGCGGAVRLRDRDRRAAVGRRRRGIVERLLADRRRRRSSKARRLGRRRLGGAFGGRLALAAAARWRSIAIGGALPLSSSVIAILKVPSTITTTLAPTSSERILEVMVEAPWPCRHRAPLIAALAAAPCRRRALRRAAAWAARRAAAMKLDVLAGSRLGRRNFADRIFGSRDALRGRGDPARAAACPARADDRAADPARSRRAAAPHAARGFR